MTESISAPTEILQEAATQSEELTENLLKMTVEQTVNQNSLEHMANHIDMYV